ncbi:hypothetical protein L6164_028672 [Bauhinia variegata]|uniref:Uncharacterized protein n=1 Tax=Bauhinia variegata TaxID=167791 RepID=A0ACB9L6I8_BAUVA|nr:hypothetical protein L6164_028672 [Bauhinia variegata]
MDVSEAGLRKETPFKSDATAEEEEYAYQSNLLQQFTSISNIDKAWIFKSDSALFSRCLFSVSQPNLLANKRKKSIISSYISKESNGSVNFHWVPFPVEMSGVSAIVPSPSGLKLLVIRNPENGSPSHFEIWNSSQMEKEFHITQSVHGSVYTDEWFQGISWNKDETFIAYVAEEPSPSKPTFNHLGYKKGGSADKDSDSWRAQGDWEDDWGETYAGKGRPALFVININSGEVEAVKGIDQSLSIGQVVWAPSTEGSEQYLVFVGWSSETRKLGIKYCNNRPCALYAVRAPHHHGSKAKDEHEVHSSEESRVLNLTQALSSALFPRFSPDGKFLVFLSARSAVDSGVHWGTNSLHRIDWPTDGKLYQSTNIYDVIPVVMCSEDGCFPGLYCLSMHSNPWLSDGCTMIVSSIWYSREVLLSVNVMSGEISHVSLANSNFSWNLLSLDGNNIVAVSSSPVDLPQIKYGTFNEKATESTAWSWSDISRPIFRCSDKVRSLLSSLQFNLIKIPIKDASDNQTKGASKPFEAILLSSKTKKSDPLIVSLHGGPHCASITSFSKSLAFLSSLGYSLLIVNYRGSIGFGEEALQSLPGKVGTQDVNDVLIAIDHVVNLGLASPSKITVMGISHGGFLTTHLIGQAPEKFVAAAALNPVCNLAVMVGTTDIPEWCYVNAIGTSARNSFTKAPSAEDLPLLYGKSPIAHLSKVKAPTLFLLGAQDRRVPICIGLQYARALKEKGVEVKIMMFPNDVHELDRPQTDFECLLNIGVWFNKHCK